MINPPPKHTVHGNYKRADYFEEQAEKLRAERNSIVKNLSAAISELVDGIEVAQSRITQLEIENDGLSKCLDAARAIIRDLELELKKRAGFFNSGPNPSN